MIKRFKLTGALLLAVLLLLTACGRKAGGQGGGEELTPVTLCLDWTPNTNYTGMYVALSQGWFEEAGLKVSIVQPPEDGAVAICAAGQVEFAGTAQDSIASAFARKDPLAVTAVAALLQHNTSGIISRAGEGMDRPAGLAGHTYSSWNTPTELAMMEHVVTVDGGDFSQVKLIPNNIVDEAGALREHQTDAIWIFYAWGGISAQTSGLDFDYFDFKDIDPVFDYYTPILIANNDFLASQPETAKAFLAAAARGYEYAIEHPEEAVQMLIDGDDTGSLAGSEEMVKASQQWIGGQYKAEVERWGYIDPARWNAFYNWLNDNDLVENPIPENTGFSNDYLPQ
ncbi:ABC transporter substrate-binding protein [Pseudoflavonifractor sp. 60]|uniref:ABC transporter substrate-binding protein n=1 Tax=Pseudoflavonifractor sp. 60 TaxID=2304576 RepID=UPI00136E4E5E|nr:ABC transporter substrate-binding protein [Pseudoflavonifractor sp. 60]NBI68926.1 ABC transporter substrate-binding protein [Pseudoflavonifractor sp. 60]